MHFAWKPSLLILLLANPLPAQVTKATVAVDGMACPFCGYGIEKRLLRVEAIERVMIDLGAGEAQVIAEPGHSIDVRDLRRAVEKAGFTPGRVEIEVTGRVISGPDEGDLQLRFESDDGSLPLGDVGDEISLRLREVFRGGRSVTLRGQIRWSEGGPELLPEHIEPELIEKVRR